MKKFLSILFLLLYINAAFGIGVDAHFCQGKVTSVKLFGWGKAGCSCPVDDMPADCCKNETTFLKSDTHKVQLDTAQLPLQPPVKEALSWNGFRLVLPAVSDPINSFHFYRFFTRHQSSRLRLVLNQVFRI